MALQSTPNLMGIPMDYAFQYSFYNVGGNIIDAAGESVAFIGKVFLEGGTGSKTISSAGGLIAFRTSTVTFANAATNFRIGIQDVAATGLEDGVYDVQANFTGGGGGLASNITYEKAMTSGTKTISQGQLIAIIFEMTTRGGTDSVSIASHTPQHSPATNQNFPYKTQDTGAGPVRVNTVTIGATIVFDDGTLGWIEPQPFIPNLNTASAQTYASNSTPDEYAAVFQVPFKCSIRSGYLSVGSVASTDNFEIILYSDAQGTPTVQQTVVVDPNIVGSTSVNAPYFVTFTSTTLSPGIWYALALRPTTTNSVSFGYIDITTTFGSKYKKALPFGINCKTSSRTNQTGAFTEVQTYHLPMFGILIDKLDDGVGGSTQHFHTF